MDLIDAIRAERIKGKHTPFGTAHLCLPALGALLFVAYYGLYGGTAADKKLKMILELTATVFPLLIGIVVDWNVLLEERASHFQALLAVPCRRRILLAKLAYLYGTGVFALFGLFFFFVIGIQLLGIADAVQLGTLLQAVVGIALCNLILYVLHLFLSLKFGLGSSLFWGVFESLQCILYSNVVLKGMARYIPFAWSINWIQDILKHQFLTHRTEWLGIAAATLGALLLALGWFARWEGRKNYE